MPDDRRLSTLVRRGEPTSSDRCGHSPTDLAAFHAGADRGPAADRQAGVDATRARWAANTAVLTDAGRRRVRRPHGRPGARRWPAATSTAGRRCSTQRIARGRACDGHGDLLADDIFCLDDGPRGPRLPRVRRRSPPRRRAGRRRLPGHGPRATSAAPTWPARSSPRTREHAADTWPASLAHHHIAYRAQVRAKVTAIRAGPGRRGGGRARPDGCSTWPSPTSRPAGSGSSWSADCPARASRRSGAASPSSSPTTVLRSDVVRKELVGLPANRPAPAAVGEGIYDEPSRRRTYETMLQRAGVALAHGESVVLDASWTDPAWRAAARRLADAASCRPRRAPLRGPRQGDLRAHVRSGRARKIPPMPHPKWPRR